jgi:hypothetical protein
MMSDRVSGTLIFRSSVTAFGKSISIRVKETAHRPETCSMIACPSAFANLGGTAFPIIRLTAPRFSVLLFGQNS